MKITLVLAAFWLTVGMSGQQSKHSTHGVLTGRDGEPLGEIHGVVVDSGGQPAKRIRLSALWRCPPDFTDSCPISMSGTYTNQAGEYRFGPMTLGSYFVFADDREAGYSQFSTPLADSYGHRLSVELTQDHPETQLRIDLPPKAGFLVIRLTDRTTGAVIPRVRVTVKAAEDSRLRFEEERPICDKFISHCATLLPPDKQLLLHVSSDGFREWDESAGTGKPLQIPSGSRLTWDVQLEPLTH